MNESIIGERFGRLVVVGYHHSNKYKSTWWLCKCDCGNNHHFTYNGVTHTIAEWSKLLNVNPETLRYRVNHNNLIDFESLTYSELITGGKENDKARG